MSECRLNVGDIVVFENAWEEHWNGVVAITTDVTHKYGPWFQALLPVPNWEHPFNLHNSWPNYVRVLGNVND